MVRFYLVQDEKCLRDKLVNRLKRREVQKIEHCGRRIDDARLGMDFSDQSTEDISDKELEEVRFCPPRLVGYW